MAGHGSGLTDKQKESLIADFDRGLKDLVNPSPEALDGAAIVGFKRLCYKQGINLDDYEISREADKEFRDKCESREGRLLDMILESAKQAAVSSTEPDAKKFAEFIKTVAPETFKNSDKQKIQTIYEACGCSNLDELAGNAFPQSKKLKAMAEDLVNKARNMVMPRGN